MELRIRAPGDVQEYNTDLCPRCPDISSPSFLLYALLLILQFLIQTHVRLSRSSEVFLGYGSAKKNFSDLRKGLVYIRGSLGVSP